MTDRARRNVTAAAGGIHIAIVLIADRAAIAQSVIER
jgi:hypothetical protein